MSKQRKHWESIIAEYKASGLSQLEFCKQQGLSSNQFKYRWYQHNLAKREKPQSIILEKPSSESSFETVVITPPAYEMKDATNNIAQLAIHLPNRIRCDVKMDIRTHAFTSLLKQLVALC
jgi:hypothetical protein